MIFVRKKNVIFYITFLFIYLVRLFKKKIERKLFFIHKHWLYNTYARFEEKNLSLNWNIFIDLKRLSR